MQNEVRHRKNTREMPMISGQIGMVTFPCLVNKVYNALRSKGFLIFQSILETYKVLLGVEITPAIVKDCRKSVWVLMLLLLFGCWSVGVRWKDRPRIENGLFSPRSTSLTKHFPNTLWGSSKSTHPTWAWDNFFVQAKSQHNVHRQHSPLQIPCTWQDQNMTVVWIPSLPKVVSSK